MSKATKTRTTRTTRKSSGKAQVPATIAAKAKAATKAKGVAPKAAPAPKAVKKSTRMTEEQLHAKQAACERTNAYWAGKSNIVPGSVSKELINNKQRCTINTIGADGQPDGNTRDLATSDLFQCHHTVEVALDLKKANRRARAAIARAAKATETVTA